MTDIEYAANELIKRLDELAIDDLLRLKLMLYIHKSFESEEVLDKNCKVLDLNYGGRNENILYSRKRT